MRAVSFLGARWVLILMALLFLPTGLAHARTEDEAKERPLGFSKLVLRVIGDPAIAIAPDEYRVHILERLRSQKVRAVGAENLVFGQDGTGEAELLLGGTIRELECRPVRAHSHCRIGITWQVLDVAADRIVYEVTTRGHAYHVPRAAMPNLGQRLIEQALDSLARRPRFRQLLGTPGQKEAAPSFAGAPFKACSAGRTPMPGSATSAMAGTVVVTSGKSFGSGFLLNEEGLILTAAHVISDRGVVVRTRDGRSFPAFPVRVNRTSDVALLTVKDPGPIRCLDLDPAGGAVGSGVYVIGSPASQDLAFSVTRGIVSGVRQLDGVQFLQTDASVSPGNSGGPILGDDGGVLAIVSWKVLGRSVEGIAFGVPIGAALEALGMTSGDRTDSVLKIPAKQPRPRADVQRPVDHEDPIPSLDPEGDRLRADALAWEAREQEESERQRLEDERRARQDAKRSAMTPAYVKGLKWGGVGLAALSTIVVGLSYSAYEDTATREEYETLRTYNDLGWIGLGVGAAAFTASLVLTPSLPPESGSIRATVTARSSAPSLGIEWVH